MTFSARSLTLQIGGAGCDRAVWGLQCPVATWGTQFKLPWATAAWPKCDYSLEREQKQHPDRSRCLQLSQILLKLFGFACWSQAGRKAKRWGTFRENGLILLLNYGQRHLLNVSFSGGGKPFCLNHRRASGPGAPRLEQCSVFWWGHSVVLQGRALIQEAVQTSPSWALPPKSACSVHLPGVKQKLTLYPAGLLSEHT